MQTLVCADRELNFMSQGVSGAISRCFSDLRWQALVHILRPGQFGKDGQAGPNRMNQAEWQLMRCYILICYTVRIIDPLG